MLRPAVTHTLHEHKPRRERQHGQRRERQGKGTQRTRTEPRRRSQPAVVCIPSDAVLLLEPARVLSRSCTCPHPSPPDDLRRDAAQARSQSIACAAPICARFRARRGAPIGAPCAEDASRCARGHERRCGSSAAPASSERRLLRPSSRDFLVRTPDHAPAASSCFRVFPGQHPSCSGHPRRCAPVHAHSIAFRRSPGIK